MVKERITTPAKAHSGKLLARAASAAKAITSKAGELVSGKSRERSTAKSKPAGTATTHPAVKSTKESIKNHGDQLASAVNAVAKPVRKNGSRIAAPVTGKKAQNSAAENKESGTKTATKVAKKTAAKSVAPAVKSTIKPASKTSGKSKLASNKTATAADKNTRDAGNDKLAAKSSKSSRKTTGATPAKDMPVEASLPRARAMPQRRRGTNGSMPETETRMRTR